MEIQTDRRIDAEHLQKSGRVRDSGNPRSLDRQYCNDPCRRCPRATPPGKPLRAAFFGQLYPLKASTFSSVPPAKSNAPATPITFRIYGSSVSQPQSFRDRVEKALADLPANGTFKDAYRNDEVVRLMAENHVIVVPSLW